MDRTNNGGWMLRTVCAGAVMSAAATASADVVIVTAGRDNTMFQSTTGGTSNGSGDGLFVGRVNIGSNRRGLIWFDVAGSLPAGATITGATLSLHLNSAGSAVAGFAELHRALADWGEGASVAGGGVGAPSQPGDATWIHRFFGTSDLWAAAGGDFAAAVSGTAPIGTAVGHYPVSGAGMIADVQAWLDAPAGNFGWVILGNEATAQSVRRFDSRESDFAPTLTIEYTIPAPGAGAVLLMGAATGMRRRRAKA